MKKRVIISVAAALVFTVTAIALAYTPYYKWMLFVAWPIELYVWVLPMTPINVWLVTPALTLVASAILLGPVFVWALTGRRVWLVGQLVLVVLLVLGFVAYAAQFFGSVPV